MLDLFKPFRDPRIGEILRKVTQIMAILDDLQAQVAQNNSAIDSAIQLIRNIKQLLDAAGTDPAKLQALKDALTNKDAELAQAIVDNTPAANT